VAQKVQCRSLCGEQTSRRRFNRRENIARRDSLSIVAHAREGACTDTTHHLDSCCRKVEPSDGTSRPRRETCDASLPNRNCRRGGDILTTCEIFFDSSSNEILHVRCIEACIGQALTKSRRH
jgi:hypothetical protein